MNKDCELNVMHIASGDLWAGAEVQMFTLATTFHEKHGSSVSVVLFNHGYLEMKLRDSGIKVIVLDETKLSGLKILRQLITNIRKLAPDVIHTHRVKENILGSIAAFICGRIPSLRTTHGTNEYKLHWWEAPKIISASLDWLCGRFLQKRIIAVSEEYATILSKQYPPDKICVIENGIDFDSIDIQANHNCGTADTCDNILRIGIAGRLVPVKRVDLFIRIARYLRDNSPDLVIVFFIYGDGPLRKELESLSQELGTDQFIYFKGHCHNMHKKIQNLDILLLTSDHEGLPMILLEAMALKTPIIAHSVGGIPQLLDHGRCGVLVSSQSLENYARAINYLAHDKHKCLEITQNARKRLETHYSAELNATAYCALYLSIM